MASLNRVTLHTHNMMEHPLFKHQNLETPLDELSAWIQTPEAAESNVSDHIGQYKRNEISIAMKLFLSSWDTNEVYEALYAMKRQLRGRKTELLILFFPEIDRIDYESDDERHLRWSERAKPLYRNVVEMLGNHMSWLGVADVSSRQLRELLQIAKPYIAFFRMDRNLQDIQNLQALARENDFKLQMHVTQNLTPARQVTERVYSERENSPVQATWIACYTISVRATASFASRGYIVQIRQPII